MLDRRSKVREGRAPERLRIPLLIVSAIAILVVVLLTDDAQPTHHAESYQRRFDRLKWRQRQVLWAGGGLVGLIALVYSDLSGGLIADAPDWLRRAIVTLPLFIGLSLGMALVKYAWCAEQMRRSIEDGRVMWSDSLPANAQSWPSGVRDAERWWLTGLSLFLIAGAAYGLAVWWDYLADLVR